MSKTLTTTPREDGFRMPSEFEPHTGCWMLWCERPDTWRNGAKPAQQAFIDVATAIAQFEPVTVGVSHGQYLNARARLPEYIRVIEISSNDAWIRDSGPTFVINDNGEIRGVDWGFNAWGGDIYFPWDKDQQVARKVIEIAQIDRYSADFILEGGSIHVDGEGTLITTEECLLHPNRNPHLTKAEIETRLRDYLNVEKIIWIPNGVFNDETNGHVDNLCCFIRPGVVALTWTEDEDDPQYTISQTAYDILCTSTDARGRMLEVHKIHQPGPLYITEEETKGIDISDNTLSRLTGTRMAASYINFYIANKGIIAPLFNDPYDKNALEILQTLFPTHKVIGVYTREILLGGGNIHCITQQQPSS